MKIALLIIGNEILNGKIQDLNIYWMTRFLRSKNLSLSTVSIVPDEEQVLMESIKGLCQSHDVLITTGGIGPTKDDITKEIVAKCFGKKLVRDEEVIQLATEHYARIGRSFDAKNSTYSLLPEDFKCFKNPGGLAPGFGFVEEASQKIILSAPGVPHEFQKMMEEVYFPFLEGKKPELKKTSYREQLVIKTKFLPEEKIFKEICPDLWDFLASFGEVSSLPHACNVDIGVVLEKNSAEELNSARQAVLDYFAKSPLKDSIWNIGPESLEEKIISIAKIKNKKIVLAESCTGGLVASRLTDISGSSAVFNGGVVTYSNELKQKILGVDSSSLELHGAVSESVALEMATGALKKLGGDIAVSLTGIAGPNGGTPEKPVGTVWIGVATQNKKMAKMFQFKGDRERLKFRFSQAALFLLLENL